jgi:HD-GYP domain-containing protein (c-di-GMP phosphodiesterase class II)
VQAEITPELERVLEASMARRRSRLLDREVAIDGAFALAFLLAATALAVFGGDQHVDLTTAGAFVLGYALVALAEFSSGGGYTVPTQVVFVPMLLLLDPAAVPLLVALAMVLKSAFQAITRGQPPERMLVAIADSWFALAPATVLVIADPGAPSFADWPVYLAALASQFALDGTTAFARAWTILQIPPRKIARELGEVYRIDALMAPLGLLAAIAAVGQPALALLVCLLAPLLRVFSRERDMRIVQQLELSRAYRGTALLLGDVIEDDDEYTGQHTRGVVILAGMVADEIGVDEQTRRETEFGALLHDVGKIAIPKEIINKPGPLDDSEWAVMKTHTIEGQRLLERVGGILGRVGVVVRASHERWDGNGYPDGLAGDAIPLASRIVSCCDAYNAMTTDRSYRAAMAVGEAIAELKANAGTQFDPLVVETVCTLVERWDPEMLDAGPVEDVDAAIRALLAGGDEE